MRRNTKQIIGFFAGACFVALGAWLFGFDFDKRGGEALTIYVFSIGLGLVVATFPFEDTL